MRAFSIIAPVAATSLYTLLGDPPIRTRRIGFQAPTANVATVFFGDKSVQPNELEAKGSAFLESRTFKSVYIKGNGSDKLSVTLFDE